jgi:hypothetical protein
VLAVTPQKAYDSYEPNNDIFSAKPIPVGKSIDANIMDNAEADWFLLRNFPGKQLKARVENRSTTLVPCISVYDTNRGQMGDGVCASNASADVQLTWSLEAGKDYYVQITSQYARSAGDYRLSVEQGEP